jgi:hypothetical protein
MSLSQLLTNLSEHANRLAEDEYSSANLLGFLVSAISTVPQLKGTYDGGQIHARDVFRFQFSNDANIDSKDANVTISNWMSLTGTGSGTATSDALTVDDMADIEDLLVVLIETNTSGAGNIKFDLSLDGGNSWLYASGMLSGLILPETYVDVSGYVKESLQVRWHITDTAGTFKVHDTKVYFQFLPADFVLEYGDVILWQAKVNLLEAEKARVRANGMSDIHLASLENEIIRLQGLAAGATSTGQRLKTPMSRKAYGRATRGVASLHTLAKKALG